MIKRIEKSIESWAIDEVSSPFTYYWSNMGTAVNAGELVIWWRITRLNDHSATPEMYFIKETNHEYVAVFYTAKGVK